MCFFFSPAQLAESRRCNSSSLAWPDQRGQSEFQANRESIKLQHLTRVLEGFELASSQVLCNFKGVQLILNIPASMCGTA